MGLFGSTFCSSAVTVLYSEASTEAAGKGGDGKREPEWWRRRWLTRQQRAGASFPIAIDLDLGVSACVMAAVFEDAVHEPSQAIRPTPTMLHGQITGTLTDLTLRAIMGECGFRWREEFLETLGEAQKKATRFGVANLFPSSRLLPAVGSRSGDGRRELTRELAGVAVEVGWS
uniref:Uncharacterized protein n=1 Tax=Oryza glaberrima TaxID=4538 RepID=I1Q3D6_ORYGL